MDSSAKSTLAMVIAVIVAVFAVACIITCTGCSQTDGQPAMGDADGRFVVVDEKYTAPGIGDVCQVIEETETGVQYLFWRNTGGLTPILNPDGMPYTGEKNTYAKTRDVGTSFGKESGHVIENF